MWPTTERRYIVARSLDMRPYPERPMALNSEDRTIDIGGSTTTSTARNHPVRRLSVEAVRSSRRLLLPHCSSRAILRGRKNGRVSLKKRGRGAIISGLLIIMIERRHLARECPTCRFSRCAVIDLRFKGGTRKDAVVRSLRGVEQVF